MKPIIISIAVIIILTNLVSAGFLTTTVRFNPSGWEDNGSVIRTLTDNPVNISGNLTIGNGFSGGGVDITTLGDISLAGDILIQGDILTITDQEINGSFLPTNDDEFSLGSAAKRWKDGFFSNNIIALGFIGNNSQWSKNNGNVFLTTSSDKVGIGTTNPAHKLTVAGSVNITGAELISNAFVNFTNNAAFNQTLFVMDSRVGIGTDSPVSALDVQGTINATRINISEVHLPNMIITELGGNRVYITNKDGTPGNIRVNTLQIQGNFFFNNNGAALFPRGGTTDYYDFLLTKGTTDNNVENIRMQSSPTDPYTGIGGLQQFKFYESGTLIVKDNLFVVNTTLGRTGIGTAKPAAMLSIARISANHWITLEDSINQVFLDISRGADVGFPGNAVVFDSQIGELILKTDNIIFPVSLQPTGGNVGIGTLTPATLLDVQGTLNISGNASMGNTLFVDNNSGRVGIGTAAPGEKLFVVGNINATGNISSGEGSVTLDGNNNVIRIGEITLDGSDSLTISNGNPVEISVQIDGSINISTNLTVNGLLILPNIIQLSPSQSTFIVRDDTSGVVGTKFGVRNTVPSTDEDSGVSYILDVGSGNNMSIDLHSSLDPNSPLTVVSHYNNNVKGHVWRLNPDNDNAFFKWEVGKGNETFMINQSGRITFGNPDVPFNISGYNEAGQLGHCGMDNNFAWSCSAG